MIFGVISFTIYIPCFSVWTTLNVSFIIIAHHFYMSTTCFNFYKYSIGFSLELLLYQNYMWFTKLNIKNINKGINCN